MPSASTAHAVSPDAEPLSFTDLVAARRRLYEDVQRHEASVNYFAAPFGFYRTEADRRSTRISVPALTALPRNKPISGVTTSITCFESLQTAIIKPATSNPDRFSGLSDRDAARLQRFVSNVGQRTIDWRSEGAARRYCIVRAAAPILRMAPPSDTRAIQRALRWVWESVDPGDPGRAAIYEVASSRGAPTKPKWNYADDVVRRRYPPNAFLTYWALAGLRQAPVALTDALASRVATARLWLNGVIGREVGLEYANSPARDPQQLAWAIAAIVRSEDRALADRGEDINSLIEAGLRAFFAQQRPDGTWDTGRALFHYPEAGNAYCYIYETLAELVGLAVDERRPFHDELRPMMLDHLPALLRARDELFTRARRLGDSGGIGWSSGHHPHRTSPESWATATAYKFLQNLRRFVGAEVRRQAAAELHARRPRKGMEDLIGRGQTWDAGSGSAGDLLGSLFVHPTRAYVRGEAAYDPDRPQLSREWARSALLYGPPGTGKTTLAEAVAGALDWDFVEITAAEFLDQGMDMVSARADSIFRQLNELDRAVVLFDEIDELVRKRTATQTDMLGRFFTTTMLPRLARLWTDRRVIFFANTNSITNVDPAIKRSQRFDATVFVMPPSHQRRLKSLPVNLRRGMNEAAVAKAMAGEGDVRRAWFPFLRYDQLEQLEQEQGALTAANLLEVLERYGTELLADWEAEDLVGLLEAYSKESQEQRRDSTRLRLVDRRGKAPSDGMVEDGAPDGYLVWQHDADRSRLDGAGRIAR